MWRRSESHAPVEVSFRKRFARRDSRRPLGLWPLLRRPDTEEVIRAYVLEGLVSIPADFIPNPWDLLKAGFPYYLWPVRRRGAILAKAYPVL